MTRKNSFIKKFVLSFITCMVIGQSVTISSNAQDIDEISSIQYSEEEEITLDGEAPEYGYEYNEEITWDELTNYNISYDESEDSIILDENIQINSSGSCTDTITWTFDNGVLTLNGTGEMPEYYRYIAVNQDGTKEVVEKRPDWYTFREEIKKVVVNNGIKNISSQAFVECTNLTEVFLADSVVEIGAASFADCINIESFNANCIESIGGYAFQGASFDTFYFNSKFHELNSLAFYDVKVGKYEVHPDNANYCTKDGVLFSKDMTSIIMYPIANARTSYTIPNTVKRVEDGAFLTAKNLKSVVFSNNITFLGENSFNATGLEEVILSDSITEVEPYTFYNCTNLKSVKFGNGLTYTSRGMFEECTALENIEWGTTLNTLGARSFAYCYGLKSVVLPANIKTLEMGVFGECSYLESFTSYGLEYLSFQVLLNCRNLTELNLNEGITGIARISVCGCRKLEKVTIPNSVKLVHSMAFDQWVDITCLNPKMDPYGRNGYREIEEISINVNRKYNYAYQVLNLVNAERTANGLSPLVMNESLLESSMIRAAENSILFSHTRPNGELTFYLNDLIIAENCAYGQSTPETVVEGWMNSAGHKANILESKYTTIGIGCVEVDGGYYWVQCFGTGSDTTNCTKPTDKEVTETIEIAVGEFDEDTTSSGTIFNIGGEEAGPYTFEFILENLNGQMDKGTSATVNVKIKNPGINGVYIDVNEDSMYWKSSNTSVATVSNGVVNMVGDGSSKITCYTKDSGFVISKTVYTKMPKLNYRTHVQTYGWQDFVTNGAMSGTSGQAKRLEGIEIKFVGEKNLGIKYKTHVQTYGWQGFVENGAMSGTSGQAKRLEAICIELTGEDKDYYDLYYRVHAQTYGWLGWAKNGEEAGTAGLAKRLEGIEIVILPKGELPETGYMGCSFMENVKVADNTANTGLVNYMVHVQSYGDQSYVYDGSISGTSGEAKRLEGIRINVNKEKLGASGDVVYSTHVQTYGWLDSVKNGEFSGTVGESKRLEAIRISLTGELHAKYDIYYRVHAQTYGWLGWAKNGDDAGTKGMGKRLEAIQIVIVPKGSRPPEVLPDSSFKSAFWY